MCNADLFASWVQPIMLAAAAVLLIRAAKTRALWHVVLLSAPSILVAIVAMSLISTTLAHNLWSQTSHWQIGQSPSNESAWFRSSGELCRTIEGYFFGTSGAEAVS